MRCVKTSSSVGRPQVTEATSSMLTSHLMMALTRVLDGAPAEAHGGDELVTAELAAHPEALVRSRRIAAHAERELGAVLPASEVAFLGMHLAVLSLRAAAVEPGGGPDGTRKAGITETGHG